jgi:hypothetical protein
MNLHLCGDTEGNFQQLEVSLPKFEVDTLEHKSDPLLHF